jgi:hypothetical protein
MKSSQLLIVCILRASSNTNKSAKAITGSKNQCNSNKIFHYSLNIKRITKNKKTIPQTAKTVLKNSSAMGVMSSPQKYHAHGLSKTLNLDYVAV